MNDHPLWQLVLARWRGFYREPGVLFWTFGFPIVLAIALGIAFKNRPPEPAITGIERGEGAETILQHLAKNSDVRATILEPEQAAHALRTGKVAIVVVPGPVRTYRFDPTRPDSRIARLLVDDALQRAEGRVDTTHAKEAAVTEPGSRYIDYLLPGLIGMGLMSSGLWGIGYVIVDMRTRKLVKRLVATPMKRTHFLLGFVIVRALFLLLELPILLGFGWLVFDVPLRGSLPLLVLLSVLGSLVFAGIGLLLASRAQNTQTVNGLINLVSMPMYIASGTFFASSRFPDVIQPVVRILPLTALNDAMRAVMLEGSGLGAIWRPVTILLVWGVASFALSLRLFRWG